MGVRASQEEEWEEVFTASRKIVVKTIPCISLWKSHIPSATAARRDKTGREVKKTTHKATLSRR